MQQMLATDNVVAILGLGVTGMSCARYFKQLWAIICDV